MQHIEFFHTDHFENNYFRIPPPSNLSPYIDFFWETRFDELWDQYPRGFSDAQFANIGYTYLVNLGTPFTMQVNDQRFEMKTDGFLPRYNAIECFHKRNNRLFGIKFRVSPIAFQKDVDFSEYHGYIFPLSYLIDPQVISDIKKAASFEDRVHVASRHFLALLADYDGPLHPVNKVSSILDSCFQNNLFTVTVEQLAAQHGVSSRTLQRYFETFTGISSKQALQIMRIRKATTHLVHSPETFDHALYGYYDHSHFYKHLRQFLEKNTLKNDRPYIKLLEKLHRSAMV
ncbi:helix-turn-helix domain-containing protein [Terrimonas sp. NA20]|uniref:Helix-turn-helix domain-containing protein n=1 Tax=Terrimonas ginsenosidimutans TaxID=2908004 RepID=A0ABS9KL62_9BACT|nr:helix-turn-helix domain-containing protein [Terrimonas ginsenosidimutans]MCG2613046.1 helix-turn-helix domain-containing protein [Terrimonas ginsenosidimutans]